MRGEPNEIVNGNNMMTDTTARPANPGAQPDEAAAPNPAAEAASAAQVDPAAEAPREAAELKDRLLRALAEMENLRRRTEREVVDARLYGIASFARDILAVADNMDRALAALDAELREKADAGVKALLDGVELTERELLKVLEKHGVRKFEPQGEKFDPNLHQAMFQVPDPAAPAGTVVEVVQPGYLIGERILRPAMVGISAGGPKASPPSEKSKPQPGGEIASANDNA